MRSLSVSLLPVPNFIIQDALLALIARPPAEFEDIKAVFAAIVPTVVAPEPNTPKFNGISLSLYNTM